MISHRYGAESVVVNGDFLARSNKCRGFYFYESRAFVGDPENAAE
jgi:hypothetical protein